MTHAVRIAAAVAVLVALVAVSAVQAQTPEIDALRTRGAPVSSVRSQEMA